jgi:hypothetical protein
MVPVLLMNVRNARFVEPLGLGEAESKEVQSFSVQNDQLCRGRFFLEHKQLEHGSRTGEKVKKTTYITITRQNVYASPLGYNFSDALSKRPRIRDKPVLHVKGDDLGDIRLGRERWRNDNDVVPVNVNR